MDEGHNHYDIRTKTKREALAAIEASGTPESYGKIAKIVVEYADGFDLMWKATADMLGERDY